MTSIGDGTFHEGQKVWIVQPDGSARAAIYVGEGEGAAWFGGTPSAYVVYPDTRSGEAVEFGRVLRRDD